MHRRSMLSWFGVSVAGAIHPASSSAASQKNQGARIVAVESFCAKNIDHMPQLHSYLSETLEPAMQQAHPAPVLYLESVIAPKAPQVLVVTSHVNFEEMLAIRERVSANANVRQARTQLESSESLREVQSQVLIAPQGSLELPAHFHKSVIELSAFSAPAWQAGHGVRMTDILCRAGIRPIANALHAPGEHLPQLTFLMPFENVGASLEAWAKLEADAEWSQLRRDSQMRLTGRAVYMLAKYSRLA